MGKYYNKVSEFAKFGPRIAGSKSESLFLEYFKQEIENFSPQVDVESFKTNGQALQNLIRFIVIGYFIALLMYLFIPLISFFISVIIVLTYFFAIYKGKNLTNLFVKQKTSRNLIAKFPATKKPLGTLILTGHYDSAYHMPILHKNSFFARYAMIGIILGLLFMIITSIWRTLTLWNTAMGFIQIFKFHFLFSSLVKIYLFPDIIYFLLVFDLFLFIYFLRNFVTKTPVLGANDNLSAIVMLYYLAEYLNTNPLNNINVKIIAFGAEEPGAYGSKNYLKRHLQELSNIRVINFDEVGWGNNIGMLKRENFINITHDTVFFKKLENLVRQLGYYPNPISTQFGFTDASSFTRKKIKALTLFTYGNHRGLGHSPEDNIDNINNETLKLIFELSTKILSESDKNPKVIF